MGCGKVCDGGIFALSPLLSVVRSGMFSSIGNGVAMPASCDGIIGWAMTIKMSRGWCAWPVWDKLSLWGTTSHSGCLPRSLRGRV